MKMPQRSQIASLLLLGVGAMGGSTLALAQTYPQPSPQPSAAPSVTPSNDTSLIDQLLTTFTAAFTADDANEIGALITDDAVFMPPNEAEYIGKANVVARYAAQFAAADATLETTLIETKVDGSTAYLRFNYLRMDVPRTGGPAVVTYGRDVMILQKQGDGSWKIWRDIWNYLPTGTA